MIDTHAHIYLEHFAEDLADVILRSEQAGVEKILLPNIDRESMEQVLVLAADYPKVCYPMVGLHPCSVNAQWADQLNALEIQLNNQEIVAIGEIGIDLHWDVTFKDEQILAFRGQVDWALQVDLPIVIHSRKSLDLILDLLEAWGETNLRGVFHCFGGNVKQAKRIEALGFMMGIGGVLTFKNSDLRSVLPAVDPDHLLLETDSPYLSPTPHRGKRNEPAYLVPIAEELARCLELTMEEVSDLTTKNAYRLFFPDTI